MFWSKTLVILHPWRLTWNVNITQLKRKIIFHPPPFLRVQNVDVSGCTTVPPFSRPRSLRGNIEVEKGPVYKLLHLILGRAATWVGDFYHGLGVDMCEDMLGASKITRMLGGVGFVWSAALSLCFNIAVLVLKNLHPLQFNSLPLKNDGWKMKYIVWTVKFPGCNFVFQHWFFVLKKKWFLLCFLMILWKLIQPWNLSLKKQGVWWCPFFWRCTFLKLLGDLFDPSGNSTYIIIYCLPIKCSYTRWFKSWPFYPPVAGHQQPFEGSLFSPPQKGHNRRIARYLTFSPNFYLTWMSQEVSKRLLLVSGL